MNCFSRTRNMRQQPACVCIHTYTHIHNPRKQFEKPPAPPLLQDSSVILALVLNITPQFSPGGISVLLISLHSVGGPAASQTPLLIPGGFAPRTPRPPGSVSRPSPHVWWFVEHPQDMSCAHKTCLLCTRHVLCAQNMSCAHKTCLVCRRHVL